MIALIAMMIVMVMLVITASSFWCCFNLGVGVLFSLLCLLLSLLCLLLSLLCLLLITGGCVHFSILYLLQCKQCPL